MQQLIDLIITGAVSGALYSLIASSVVLSYSASGIFNLAFGGISFTSAFVYYELTDGCHLAVGYAAVITILMFAPALGWVLNRVIFRRLSTAPEEAKIMATVGLLVALPALAPWLIAQIDDLFNLKLPSGNDVYVLPGLGPTPAKVWHLPLGVTINSDQAIVFVATAAVAVGLWLLLRHSRFGLQMRAQVDRPALASYRGINGNRTTSMAWMLSTMIAALAGVIGAPILNSLTSNVFNVAFFVAVAAAVLGGLRSIPRAFIFGLVIGIAQNLVFGYAHFAQNIQGFGSSVPFVLLLAGLFWMGRKRTRRAGSAVDAVPETNPNGDLPPWRRVLPWAVASAALLVFELFLADSFWQGLVANGLAVALVFLSFTIVIGLGGMVSLAQGAFVTSAGLTTGLLLAHGLPFFPAMLCGIATAVVLGVICALPALRVSGLALALATLALGFLGDNVLFSWSAYENSSAGWTIPRLSLGPVSLASNRTMAVFLFLVILIVVVLIKNLRRSANGRAMIAVRSSETAAETVGVRSRRTKLMIFALSAVIAGLGGILLSSFDQSATGGSAPTQLGLLWVATVVLFGVRRPAGAVLAGLSVVISPEIWQLFTVFGWKGLQSTYFPSILFGLGAITMAQNPEGSLAVFAVQRAAQRAKRRAKMAARVAVSPLLATTTSPVAAAVPAATAPAGRAGPPSLPPPAPVPVSAAPAAPAGSPAGRALEVASLRAGYGEIEVIHGIDLVLEPGTITALLGANGAGKSTFCGAVAGGLAGTTGQVVLAGSTVDEMAAYQRSRAGLVLAPESRGVFPGLTVEENLLVWFKDRTLVDRAIGHFPVLGERRRTVAGNLSGGEQQVLTLAPLLVRPPQVLICDEPTLGLAPLVVRQVLEILRQLSDEGVAVLLVEEKLRGLLEVADRVSFLQLGRIVWSGDPASVDEAELATSYLGAVSL